MLDFYHVLVPVFSIITILNLIALKLALRDNATLSKIVPKKQATQLIKQQSEEQENKCRSIMKFLLISFTPMQFFLVRRAKYKIGFFLALSIVTIASYFLPSLYATAPLGTLVFLVYIVVEFIINRRLSQENQQKSSNIVIQNFILIGCCVISLLVNLTVIGLVFKNYHNLLLASFIRNSCINSILDNFLVRPLTLVLLSLPLSRSENFIIYMKQWQNNLKYLRLNDEATPKQMLQNHEKRNSQNKNAAIIEFNLQIQPMPFQQEPYLKLQEQVTSNALNILTKINKQTIQPPLTLDLQKNVQCEVPLYNNFDANYKQQYSEPLLENLFQQIPQNIGNEQINDNIDFLTENLIKVNPNLQENMQSQKQILKQQIIQDNIIDQDQLSSQNRETEINDHFSMRQEEQKQNAINRVSLHSSIQNSSKQQKLKVYLNEVDFYLQQQQNQQNQQYFQIVSKKRKRNFMTIEQNSNRNAHAVLKIKDKNLHQTQQNEGIEEIDLNSPQRRRRQAFQVEIEGKQKESKVQVVKRKKKRLSHDHGNNRVLKFSTGQPYLEYLPNMLEKDNKGKKSQSINKKDVIIDCRANNTGKKTKKRLLSQQNNENMVQVFKIQDL